ncbi:MAG: glycosyltransferase [Bacteriovoracaceae bacterium]
MELAVLILTHGRGELLKKCLDSLKDQREHPFRIKLYVMVNGQDQETESYLDSVGQSYQALQDPKPVGEARNLLIEEIGESHICFLDDDIVLPPDYFKKASDFMAKMPEVDIFGGPDQNPPESTNFQLCLGMVMESYFATGPTNKRHKQNGSGVEEGDELNLILCNFWAKREVFDIQKFPKDFKRNEENFLLSILKDRGVKMRRVPDMYVYHNRKVSPYKLVRVLFLAGIYRMVSIFYYPRSARPVFFLHQLFLLILIITGFYYFDYFLLITGAYLFLIASASLIIAIKTKKLANTFLSMLLFILFNFAYPAGQFVGYFKAIASLARGQKFE